VGVLHGRQHAKTDHALSGRRTVIPRPTPHKDGGTLPLRFALATICSVSGIPCQTQLADSTTSRGMTWPGPGSQHRWRRPRSRARGVISSTIRRGSHPPPRRAPMRSVEGQERTDLVRDEERSDEEPCAAEQAPALRRFSCAACVRSTLPAKLPPLSATGRRENATALASTLSARSSSGAAAGSPEATQYSTHRQLSEAEGGIPPARPTHVTGQLTSRDSYSMRAVAIRALARAKHAEPEWETRTRAKRGVSPEAAQTQHREGFRLRDPLM